MWTVHSAVPAAHAYTHIYNIIYYVHRTRIDFQNDRRGKKE